MLRYNIAKAYKVNNVIELDRLEKQYNIALSTIPAIYVIANKKVYEYDINDGENVMQKYGCSIYRIR